MKKIVVCGLCVLFILVTALVTHLSKDKLAENNLTGTIIAKKEGKISIQDKENIIYTFASDNVNAKVGDSIILNYLGVLNKNTEEQNNKIVNYEITEKTVADLNDKDIFGSYYLQATNKLNTLSLDEKIGQLFLVRYSDKNAQDIIKNYHVGGFVFYENDFKDKTADQVKEMINNLQKNSKIGLLTSVDEEGGKIIRISSNANLVSSPFKSPSVLYNDGGMPLIKSDTIYKSAVLKDLGLNLNLAPVVDVASDPNAYMYPRTIEENTNITAEYAKTVIEASKNTGVSYTLKHFPGYGNNTDTHIAQAIDTRSYNDILTNDIPPFREGINAGAEAVLVGHNTVAALDNTNPASISISVHNLLRNELKFTGVVITDDLDMGGVTSITNRYTKAILSGNDLIITTDYNASINEIKDAINNNIISESSIDNAALRVLAWKYYKGLINDAIINEK